MKKIIPLLLVALLLAGCQRTDAGHETPTETTTAPTETVCQEGTIGQIVPQKPAFDPAEPGESLAFSNPGKTRITYTPTGIQNFVRYVTSVEELPDVEALAGYDAEFFENNALLIVVETVSSGSVRLDIDAIYLRGDTATVKLKRTMEGDFGTDDMATWMLWAEVSPEWDYNWTLADRAQPAEGEKY